MEKISQEYAEELAARRYGNPRLFNEVRHDGELLGWTYVAKGNFTTTRFGYITVDADHPHATVDYRSYAEEGVRQIMGKGTGA